MDAVAKYTAKQLLGQHMQKNRNKSPCGKQDPYFENVPVGRKGKMKKVKRRIPDYIPEHDAQILADVRRRAYMLDMCLFNFMGIRFGWSSVIGLVPEVGDFVDLYLAWRCYRKIRQVDCPLKWEIIMKMQGYIILDFLVGLVPLVGDLCDAGLKCNTKNVTLLAEAMDEYYAKDRNGDDLDQRTRKRASRQLFEDDPDFAQGPPPYREDPTEPPLERSPGFVDRFRAMLGLEKHSDPEQG